jgi:GNAT superfamily N-acetyltransferase
MDIRRADPGDAKALSAIARASKMHWGYPPEWLEQWRDALTVQPDFIRENSVFVGDVDDVAAGFYALTVEGPAAVPEHLWVHPDHIGRGLGRALLHHARATAVSLGATEMRIDSDPHAEAFYAAMGARRQGEVDARMGDAPRVLPRMVLPLDGA